MTSKKRLIFSYGILALLLAVLFAANLFWGSVSLTPGGSAGGPDRPRAGRFERGHHHPAAPAPGRDGGAAGGGALGSGLPAATFLPTPLRGRLSWAFPVGAKLVVAMTMVVFLNHGLLTNSLTLILAAFAGSWLPWPLCSAWRAGYTA